MLEIKTKLSLKSYDCSHCFCSNDTNDNNKVSFYTNVIKIRNLSILYYHRQIIVIGSKDKCL